MADQTALQISRLDGSVRDVEASASLLPGQTGDALQIVFYDTTVARQNVRLLQASRDESQRLSANLLSVREEERKHIARELHDELGQRLSALKMQLSGVAEDAPKPARYKPWRDRLEELLDDTDEIVRAVRRIASDLRPAMLDDLGLQAAIEWLARNTARRLGVEVAVDCGPGLENVVDPVRVATYRLVQEG